MLNAVSIRSESEQTETEGQNCPSIELSSFSAKETDEQVNPFIGLNPFSAKDADFFFGRKEDIQTIINRLENSPLTVLYGQSGIGKSSLLGAGVFAQLRQKTAADLETHKIPESAVVMFPPLKDRESRRRDKSLWENPLDNLKEQIHLDLEGIVETVFQKKKIERISLPSSDLSLVETLRRWTELLTGEDKEESVKLYIILDQFEDYLLSHSPEKENTEAEGTFACEFCRAIGNSNLPVHFLIAIRQSSFTQLSRFKGRISDIMSRGKELEFLNWESGREAIEKPVEKYNQYLEAQGKAPVLIGEKLVDTVLDEVKALAQPGTNGNGSGALGQGHIEAPYLQLVMQKLWQEELKSKDLPYCLRTKTLEEDLGGAKEIARKHWEAQISQPEAQEIALSVFRYLAMPSGNKIAWTVFDLVTLANEDRTGQAAKQEKLNPKKVENLLQRLSDSESRIVRPVAGGRYEIFFPVLSEIIREWLEKSIRKQERANTAQIVSVAKDAIIQALELRSSDDLEGAYERSALLALQAYAINQESQIQTLKEVDRALRKVLRIPYFSPILEGHNSKVSSVAFSPDGQTLASGSYDGTVWLWNLCQPGSSPKILPKQEGEVTTVAFGPQEQWLASGYSTGQVRLWDLSQPEPQPRLLPGYVGRVTSVAFSPDGELLAFGSREKGVGWWYLSQLDAVPVVPRVLPSDWVCSVAFSPHGKRLAAGCLDGTVRLWNPQQPEEDLGVFSVHEDDNWHEIGEYSRRQKGIFAIAFHPTGILAVGCNDGVVRWWDLREPEPKLQVLRGHTNMVKSVAFSPDGKWLASSSEDQTVRLLDVQEFDKLVDKSAVVLHGHDWGVSSVAFSPDSRWLASSSWKGKVLLRLWDLESSDAEPQVLRHHLEQVRTVAFSPDGKWLASGGKDNIVYLWDREDLKAPPLPLEESYYDSDSSLSLAFSPDSKILAAGSYSYPEIGIPPSVRLWDLRQPEAKPTILHGHEKPVRTVAFSPDGRWLASGGWDQTVRLWNIKQLEDEPIVLRHEGAVKAVAFSPDSKWLASGSWDENGHQTLRLWELSQIEPPLSPSLIPKAGDSKETAAIAFSRDEKWLAAVGEDGVVHLWERKHLEDEPRNLNGYDFKGSCVAFSPDSQFLAAGSQTRTIWLWNLHDLDSPPTILSGHEKCVQSVAFSPDSQFLASGSDDWTIRVWTVSVQQLADKVGEKVWRNMTMREWGEFVSRDLPYQRTCPKLPSGKDAPPDAPAAKLGESRVESTKQLSSEVSVKDFSPKFLQPLPEQQELLDFIARRAFQGQDSAEQDVTTLLERPKGNAKTYLQLETLRLLGFLLITDSGTGPGTIRYGVSPGCLEFFKGMSSIDIKAGQEVVSV